MVTSISRLRRQEEMVVAAGQLHRHRKYADALQAYIGLQPERTP
jgi:hypothetical protein